jgi:hypothetical protein
MPNTFTTVHALQKVPTHLPTFFEEPKVHMEYFQCVTIELGIAHT